MSNSMNILRVAVAGGFITVLLFSYYRGESLQYLVGLVALGVTFTIIIFFQSIPKEYEPIAALVALLAGTGGGYLYYTAAMNS